MDQKHWAEAASKLQESQRLDPAVGTLLNLAECWVALGKTASAWSAYRDAASTAASAQQPDRERFALKRARALEGKLSYLTIQVPESVRAPGLTVTRDGVLLSDALWGTAVPVDPGTVRIVAEAPGRMPWSVERVVGDRKDRVEVTIPLLDSSTPAAASAAPSAALAPEVKVGKSGIPDTLPGSPSAEVAPPPPPSLPDRPGRDATWAWIAGGTGIAALGVGAYFYLDSGSELDALGCSRGEACRVPSADKIRHDDARSEETRGLVLGGAGLALVGVGAYLLLGSNDDAASTTGLTLGVGPGGGAACWRARW